MGITKDIIEAEFRTRGGSQVQRDMAEVQKNIALINHENERLRVTKSKLEAQNKKGSKEWKNVNQKIKENNKQLGANKAKLKVLQSQMKITDMTAKQLKDHYYKLSREIAKTNKELHPERWNRLNKELKETDARLNKVQGRSNKARSSMGSLKNIASTFLPVAGAAAFVGVLKSAGQELFNLTKQMQGDAVRSSTVFGDQMGYVQEQAAKVAKQMGLTNREFVANAAATADLLIPLDFSREAAAKMSVELQQLTGALDEWTGGSVGAAEVSNILTKAMLGENEQLKQLGIAIQMDSKEFKDLVKVKKAAGDVTEAQAKAMATLELITKKSADAQAAYNQEGNKLLRMQKQMSLWWKNIKEGVVEAFDAWLNGMTVEDRMESFNQNLQKNQMVMNTLFNTIKDTTVGEETRKEAIKKLNEQYGTYLPYLITEKSTLNEIATAQEHANKALIVNLAIKRKQADIDAVMNDSLERQKKLSEEIIQSVEKKGPGLGGIFYQEYLNLIDESIKKGDAFNRETQNSIGQLAKKYNVAFMDIFEATKETFDIRAEEASQVKELTSFYDAYINKYKEFVKESNVVNSGNEEVKTKYDPKAELKKLEDANKQIQNELKRALLAREMTEAEYHGASLAQELEYLDQKKTLTVLAGDSIVDIEGQIYDRRLQMQKEYQSMLDQMRKDAQKIAKDVAQSEKDQDLDLRKLDESEMNRILDELNDAKKAANELNLLRAETPEEYRDVSRKQEDEAYLEEKRAMEAYELEHQVDLSTQKELLHEQHNIRLKEIDEQYLNERYQLQQQHFEQINAFSNAAANGFNAVASIYEAAKERELAAAGKNEAKREAIRKKYAKKEKAVATGLAFINGATAIMNVWAKNTMPYPAAAVFNAIQTAAIGVTTAAQIAKINSQKFYTGGYTGGSSKYKPAGIVHEDEFVVNQDGNHNPTVKPFLDIIDVAQKNGSIKTLDLNAVMASKAQAAGATSLANASTAPTIITRESPETMAILQRTTDVLDRLEQHGVKGIWEYQNYKEGRQQYEDLEQDVSF